MRHFVLILLVAVLTAGIGIWQFWLPPQIGSTHVTQFTVASGEGSRTVATHLAEQGFIRSSLAFLIYARMTGVASHLKTGIYLISPGMSVSHIADIIASGKGISDDIEVTIPEGANIWTIDTLIASASAPIWPGQMLAAHSKEGYLFPETYRFAKNATAAQVVARMTGEFTAQANQFTPTQVIIASILEKEAKTADDMALVSGIIAARIARGMPLQVDATVAYGWCVRRTAYLRPCDVTQAPIATEIKVDGPYNTYTHTGLPIGPIANPGLKALTAAKYPKTSDYLYYLSTRDGSQIIYAKTLAEHLRNRQKYLGF